MNRLHSSLTLAFLCTVSTLGLSGCAGFGAASFPDASVNPTATSIGSIQGEVHGGHAPLVGAHVYVVEVPTGASAKGYGVQATSLLGVASGATENPASGGDPNIPNAGGFGGWYYLPTNSAGAFNITGDYTCTAGDIVYLYAYGGSPTYPSASNVFQSNTFTVESISGSNYTLLFTTTSTELFYTGEPIALSNYTGNYSSLNTLTGNVLGGASNPSAILSPTQFEITVNDTNGTFAGTVSAGNSYSASGTITATPGFNPGVVNLAVLGICPSTGSLAGGGTIPNGATSSPITYIFMNEVSTVAAAFALEGFTPPSPTSTTNATDIGTSTTNTVGLQNAALNAGLLYDLNGPYFSTVYDGEGNIANPVTPNGNGSVPQNLLDTLGNILAACVDSNNTSATASPQCTTLFNTATSNGIPIGSTGAGVAPIDTAQAAINIAHYPAGNPAYTGSPSFVNALYTLPTGNVPFTPNLASAGAGQPNDFTVAIQYPYNYTTNAKISSEGTTTNLFAQGPESIAIDGYGNVWVDSIPTQTIYEISAQGVAAFTGTSPFSGSDVGYLTIDPSNNVWAGNHGAGTGEWETTAYGTANLGNLYTTPTSTTHGSNYYDGYYGSSSPWTGPAGFFDGYASVSDWSGNIFIGAAPNGGYTNSNAYTAQWYTAAITGAANVVNDTNASNDYIANPVILCSGGCTNAEIGHGAIQNRSSNSADGTSQTNGHANLWWTGEAYDYPGYPTNVGNAVSFVALVNAASSSGGAEVSGSFPIFYGTNNVIEDPTNLSVDSSGNAWVAAQGGNSVFKVTPAAVVTNYTGNTFSGPFAVAIDGAGNAFVTNRSGDTGTSIAEFNTIGTPKAISPASAGYTLGGQITAGPLNDAIDQSGNLWITSYASSAIIQWIGAGLPAGNPLSSASYSNTLGYTP
jgi:hypothetical protein